MRAGRVAAAATSVFMFVPSWVKVTPAIAGHIHDVQLTLH